MKRDVEFAYKEYTWGWSLWIVISGSKVLIADKLKTQEEVFEFIDSLPKMERNLRV